MIGYQDNVKAGDHVVDTWAGETLLVTDVTWRSNRGWEAHTQRPSGYSGPVFCPHPDRMPSPDRYV